MVAFDFLTSDNTSNTDTKIGEKKQKFNRIKQIFHISKMGSKRDRGQWRQENNSPTWTNAK